MSATSGSQHRYFKPLSSPSLTIKDNLFTDIHRRLRMFPSMHRYQGLNLMTPIELASRSTFDANPLEAVRNGADIIAMDIIQCSINVKVKRAPNKHCNAMRTMVKELLFRHNAAFKSMIQKLNVTQDKAFIMFVAVADEIFMDGIINWGRIIAVYALAATLAKHCQDKAFENNITDRIALYTGKYVANKLGHWILDNGGWEAFSCYFTDKSTQSGDKLWTGLLLTAVGALGLGTLTAMTTGQEKTTKLIKIAFCCPANDKSFKPTEAVFAQSCPSKD